MSGEVVPGSREEDQARPLSWEGEPQGQDLSVEVVRIEICQAADWAGDVGQRDGTSINHQLPLWGDHRQLAVKIQRQTGINHQAKISNIIERNRYTQDRAAVYDDWSWEGKVEQKSGRAIKLEYQLAAIKPQGFQGEGKKSEVAEKKLPNIWSQW